MVWFIGTCVLAMVVIWVTHRVHRWRNPKLLNNRVLPPGSLGLPLIGETLQLVLNPGNSLDVLPFLKKRIKRYGRTFRTNILGRSIVVSADPKFCHFVLQQDGKTFESWSSDTFVKLFAQDGETSTNVPEAHRYIRGVVVRQFGAGALREKLLPLMEEAAQATIRSWLGRESVEVKYGTATMAIGFSAKHLFSYNPAQSTENLCDLYFQFVQGQMAIPVNVPGTTHYKCLKNHKKALAIMRRIVRERLMSSTKTSHDDMLTRVIEDMDAHKFLTEDAVAQLMFGLPFVTFDSIAMTLALVLKFLEENPRALKEIIDEHEAIIKRRQVPDFPLTWEEYKSMTFTLHVIHESLRLGNISPGIFRRSKTEVEWDGYTIPAGWTVLAASSALHLDPQIYKDPLKFDPWRWQDCKSDAMLKNFMPFGWGMKQCAGSEYARVFMSTFLHVFLTKYRWVRVKGGVARRNPMLSLGEGLFIKVSEKPK